MMRFALGVLVGYLARDQLNHLLSLASGRLRVLRKVFIGVRQDIEDAVAEAEAKAPPYSHKTRRDPQI